MRVKRLHSEVRVHEFPLRDAAVAELGELGELSKAVAMACGTPGVTRVLLEGSDTETIVGASSAVVGGRNVR